MKRSKPVVLILCTTLIALTAGLFVGFHWSLSVVATVTDPTLEISNSATRSLLTLRLLRSNDVERAISWLEMDLQSDLSALQAMEPDLNSPFHQFTPSILRAIREYRETYPYSSGNPGLDSSVDALLESVQNGASEIRYK